MEYDPQDLPPSDKFDYRAAVAIWDMRWRHQGGRMAAKSACLFDTSLGVDQPYVRNREEVPYARRGRGVIWPFLKPEVCQAIRDQAVKDNVVKTEETIAA